MVYPTVYGSNENLLICGRAFEPHARMSLTPFESAHWCCKPFDDCANPAHQH